VQAPGGIFVVKFDDNTLVTVTLGQAPINLWETKGSPFLISSDTQGRVLIDGVLYDEDGRIVADIADSQVRPRVPGYDSNADGEALEVVNSDGLPVLQITRPYPSSIEIYGRFVMNGLMWACDKKGCETCKSPGPCGRELAPLFRYPSYEFNGARVKDQP
jgi:hypothetical protein